MQKVIVKPKKFGNMYLEMELDSMVEDMASEYDSHAVNYTMYVDTAEYDCGQLEFSWEEYDGVHDVTNEQLIDYVVSNTYGSGCDYDVKIITDGLEE